MSVSLDKDGYVTQREMFARLQSQTRAYGEGPRLREEFPFHAKTIMMNDLESFHSLLTQVSGLGQGIGAQCGQCNTVVDDLDTHWLTCEQEGSTLDPVTGYSIERTYWYDQV